MHSSVNSIFLLLLLPLLVSVSHATSFSSKEVQRSNSNDDDTCVYTLYVRTSTVDLADTRSTISLALTGADDHGYAITDLVSWGGVMGADHKYFLKGNLDIFSGRGPCLPSPVCSLNLTSDGSGEAPGWYCDYVQLTTVKQYGQCAHQLFVVEQWLAPQPGYQLYAIRDYCAGGAQSEPQKKVAAVLVKAGEDLIG